jgi:hypothetical protein
LSFIFQTDGMTQIYQSTRQFIGDHPHVDPEFHQIEDTVSQVMTLAHEEHRLALPTHLTTQPFDVRGSSNVPQTVRRRRRRLGIRVGSSNNEDQTDQNVENFEVGGTSTFPLASQNYEEGGTSDYVPGLEYE